MTLLRRYLKPSLLASQIDLARTVLAPGLAVAVIAVDDGLMAGTGAGAGHLLPDHPAVAAMPLTIDGAVVGHVVVGAADGAAAATSRGSEFWAWVCLLAQGFQAVLDAEHARRAVAAETLNSYREVALLHRAALELNRSLRVGDVAQALLKEFEGKGGWGAVFLRSEGTGALMPVGHFGAGAEVLIARFQTSALFAALADGQERGIVDRLDGHPLWADEVPDFHSLLALPLVSYEEGLGLLVLATGAEADFAAGDLKRAETLGSVAAAALRNAYLFDARRTLFKAFADVIGSAIDAKSPYTAGHCRRVPAIARMLAEAACAATDGPFRDFTLDEDGWEALELAASLHDCGKVTTPEWVLDKATKLQCMHDRIHEVAARIAVLKRDAEIACWRARAEGGADPVATGQALEARRTALDETLAFLRTSNQGAEFMSSERMARVRAVAAERWCNADGLEGPLLSEDEVANLCIVRGTLTPAERKVIEEHVVLSIDMLEQLPFPKALRHVPEYAGGHHERMDGSGYPRGLAGNQLSVPARIIAIADIFEALTAADRPYRRRGTLGDALAILGQMKRDNHIDADLFDLMVATGIPRRYAEQHLKPDQTGPDQTDGGPVGAVIPE